MRTLMVVALAALAGCVTPVHFDSDPPGAVVAYKGQPIGITPFDYELADEFGWFSIYAFSASKPGFGVSVQTFQEPAPPFAGWIVPRRVEFKLKKDSP